MARITGDPSNDIYQGYTCVKGRALAEAHNDPERLRQSQKHLPDGNFEPVSSDQLMDEVAARLMEIIGRHGPESVALYFGTMVMAAPVFLPVAGQFMRAIGSPMLFNPNTIDQPGKDVSQALQGAWCASARDFNDPDVALVVGANPLVTYTPGLPFGHPGKWLQRWSDRGFQLIVIDPRRSDTAKRASLFLQPRPGEDVAILAGMLRVILSEGLYDAAFVEENVSGLEMLRDIIAPFTPEYVAKRADIDADDLVTAARTFAGAERGYACVGTGPEMSGGGTLIEYLVRNLNALCGRYLRAGEQVPVPPTLIPSAPMKAQARAPYPAYGLTEPLPGTDLRGSVAGLPVAGLSPAILHDGDNRIRALISIGGNPVMAWPDQLRTVEALQALDLLVQVDVTMSATALLAHYVVAATMSLEVPSFTLIQEMLSAGSHYVAIGHGKPWAQYTEKVIDPPTGSDLLEEWEFLYGLAQRMGLNLEFSLVPGGAGVPLDMENKPSTEELLKLCAEGSRVALEEVRRHPHGGVFPDPPVVVEPRDPGCTDRFDVANPDMMRDLKQIASEPTSNGDSVLPTGERLEFRLLCRRLTHVINSTGPGRSFRSEGKRTYNPAFMHPEDLQRLGLKAGDLAEIRSARAAINAVVEPDATLRPGLVSMTHAYGGLPGQDDDPRVAGSNTGRLLTLDEGIQPYTGQPLMSNVPVSVRAIGERPRTTLSASSSRVAQDS